MDWEVLYQALCEEAVIHLTVGVIYRNRAVNLLDWLGQRSGLLDQHGPALKEVI